MPLLARPSQSASRRQARPRARARCSWASASLPPTRPISIRLQQHHRRAARLPAAPSGSQSHLAWTRRARTPDRGGLRLFPSTREETRGSRSRWLWLLAAALASHLLMDTANGYGAHLFYPLSSRWVYGDSVFELAAVAVGHPRRPWTKNVQRQIGADTLFVRERADQSCCRRRAGRTSARRCSGATWKNSGGQHVALRRVRRARREAEAGVGGRAWWRGRHRRSRTRWAAGLSVVSGHAALDAGTLVAAVIRRRRPSRPPRAAGEPRRPAPWWEHPEWQGA